MKKGETIYVKAKTNEEANHQKYAHSINIIDNTILERMVGKHQIQVNSKHNYHVQTTINLVVSAYSEDGLIEAVEHPNKEIVIGVQWHPETMLDYDEYANKIIDAFINTCRKRK